MKTALLLFSIGLTLLASCRQQEPLPRPVVGPENTIPCREAISRIKAGPDGTISWEDAVKLVTCGDVKYASQSHSLDVFIQMKDGTYYETVEPGIDDIWRVIEQAGKRGDIIYSTE